MVEAMAWAGNVPLVTGIVAGGGFSLEKHIRLGNVQPALKFGEPVANWTSSKHVV
jgi:hypothetical protein